MKLFSPAAPAVALLAFLLCAMPTVVHADDSLALTAYTGELFPYNYVAKDGKLAGISVDIIRELAERTGLRLEEILHISWARSLLDVQEGGPGRVIFSVGRTEKRESQYAWVGPVGSLRLGLVARKDAHIRIAHPCELVQFHIGVIRNSAPVSLLEGLIGKDSNAVKLLSSNEMQFRMLREGRIDMITQSASAAPRIMRIMGLEPDEYEMIYVLKQLELYLAFSRSTPPAIINRLQQELDRLREPGPDGTSEYERIVSHHLGGGPISLSQGDETPGIH